MIDQICSMALTNAHHTGRAFFTWTDLVEAMTVIESGSAINVTTFVTIAFARLRAEAPVAARLLELLAFMAAEPVSLALLRIGLDKLGNDVLPPLNRTVHSVGAIDRAAQQAVRFGLARVAPDV